MNILDIILLICFIPALVQGFRKGLISQVTAIISIIAGVWFSIRFTPMVSEWLGTHIAGSAQVLKVVSFTLIFIAISIALILVGRLLEKFVKLIMMGWLNRLLGSVLALAKAGLIIGIAIMIFCSLDNTFDLVSDETLNNSILFPPLKELAYTIYPHLKEMLFRSL